jgi:hypothetical protein
MKLISLPAAIVLSGIVLLSSCVQEESSQGISNSSREMTFSAYAKKGSRTRAAETTSSSLRNFNVFAVWSGNGPLPNLSPALVERPDDVTPWDYSPKQYWPGSGTINFYAFSPNGAASPNYSRNDYSDMSIDYTIPAIGSQQDLLVAVNEGVSCVNPTSVSLRFQHALSRIQLKARSVIVGADEVKIYGVSFLRLKNSGTLALDANDIPNNRGLRYEDGPQVLWTAGQSETNYVFDLTGANAVTIDDDYTDVIAGNDALMVLPQVTALGSAQPVESESIQGFDDLSDLSITDPADGKFYIKIVFAADNDPDKIYVRYYAVKDPTQLIETPLSFEAGRSYTFVVDLSDGEIVANILFAGVEVQEMDDAFGDTNITPAEPEPDPVLNASYMPKPHRGIAGSNIYWDAINERLTFDDVDVKTNEHYQGVLFKWGSLIGISPVGSWNGNSTPIYAPGPGGDYIQSTAMLLLGSGSVDAITSGSIENIASIANVTDLRTSGYLSFLNLDQANLTAFKGDVCAYLSGRPGVPAGYWRMPTSAEFDCPTPFNSPGDYEIVNPFNFLNSGNADGTHYVPNGYHLTYAPGKKAFFPASGYRMNTGVISVFGYQGFYWSASPNNWDGHNLFFDGTEVRPNDVANRTHSLPVRCVKK